MNKLFYDTDISGHHSEYISHLVDYLAKNKLVEKYIFIVHPDFLIEFPHIIIKAETVANIKLVAISLQEHTKINQGNLILRSIKTYELMDKYAKRFSATHVCLLHFNIFQFALGLFKQKYEIISILFLQFNRMQTKSLNDKLKYLRKKLQTGFYIRNKQIKKVFVLNDQKTVEYLNMKFSTTIFHLLPDPVPEVVPLPNFNIYNEYLFDKERKIFLHVGSLSKRKGSINILDSFNHLEIKDLDKIVLLMIGKTDQSTDTLIKNKIALLNQKFENIVIVYKNEFISESKMKSLFEQCHIVLVPYKNVEVSSGIIGHSIAARKPVIGINKGLLGEMIEENKLGILIQESTPELIAEGIKEAVRKDHFISENERYLLGHSKEKFAEILIGALK